MHLTPADQPDWVKGNDVTQDDKYIHCVGFAQADNLIDAWKLAQEEALRKYAKYKLLNVTASLPRYGRLD